jgi:hypothetical protein
LLALLPVLILVVIALVPFSLVQRYRVATRRQRARGWLIGLNVAGLTVSALAFLIGAGFTSIWVPKALTYSAGGMLAGALLGLIGLLVTKWEHRPDGLYFTPSRVLVLGIMLIVTARIVYGFWRAVHVWHTASADDRWLGVTGVADSMAAGAIALGYFLVYWIGVRRRVRRGERRLV